MVKKKKSEKKDWRSATDEEKASARKEILAKVGEYVQSGCRTRDTDEMCAKELLIAIRMASSLATQIERRLADESKLRRVFLDCTPCEIVATIVDSVRCGMDADEYDEFSVAAKAYLEFAWAAAVMHQTNEAYWSLNEITNMEYEFRESPLYSSSCFSDIEKSVEATNPPGDAV